MRCQDFDGLDVARFELRLRAESSCSLPPFLGSTLRGSFGHALRDVARAIEGRDCNGCNPVDPCVYHYLFETPVPPDVVQLRGQREAPVPFILSPPVVENPIRRVWRVPAAVNPQSANPNQQSLGGFADLGVSARNASPQSAILNPQSLSVSADLDVSARNPSPQFAIRDPQSLTTSVIFPDGPRRYRAGDSLTFDLVLIGRATRYLDYVVVAVAQMARGGLGAARARFELVEVRGPQTSWLPTSRPHESQTFPCVPLSDLIRERLDQLRSAQPASRSNGNSSESVEGSIDAALEEIKGAPGSSLQPPATDRYSIRLHFLTPVRIRVAGDLQTELSFESLARNLLRRVSLLTAVHGRGAMELDYRELIELAGSVATRRSGLRWWDLDRYTNRQGGKLKVGGLIGEVEYEGDAVREFLPLLAAGEVLNVGTGTSFGLGRYRILGCGNRAPL